MVAATILTLVIAGSITVIQRGFQSVDYARHVTYASQVMQSELERLRLKSWAQIQELQNSRETLVSVASTGGTSASFRCERKITDLKTDMKQIELVSTWTGYDGRPQVVRYLTRYSKSGLYDYFYTAH